MVLGAEGAQPAVQPGVAFVALGEGELGPGVAQNSTFRRSFGSGLRIVYPADAWAPTHAKTLSLTSVVFIGLLAGLTSSLHFVVLTPSHQSAFAEQSWLPLFMTFKWPSVVYALDILAWDVFFPISVLFAAPVFRGTRLTIWVRRLMIASGVLAFAGLSGVALGNMQWRNIGIVGDVGVFPVAAALLLVLFRRTAPREA